MGVCEESALAMAQSLLCQAGVKSNTNIPEELLKGEHDLTVRELAKNLARCGYELNISISKRGRR